MAVTYTLLATDSNGPIVRRYFTFTSAAGDGNGETIATATHGLSRILDAKVTINPGGLGEQAAKVTYADGSGTVTWTVDDTQGYSGRVRLEGQL